MTTGEGRMPPERVKERENMGKIVSINVSSRKRVPKKPANKAELVPGMGIAGDAHAAPGDRQLSLLMMESIERQRDLIKEQSRKAVSGNGSSQAVELVPGIYAENLTTEGIDLMSLNLGDALKVGQGIRLRTLWGGRHPGSRVQDRKGMSHQMCHLQPRGRLCHAS